MLDVKQSLNIGICTVYNTNNFKVAPAIYALLSILERRCILSTRFFKDFPHFSCLTSFFSYKVTILLLTFMSYTCFHLSRKAISVVKPVLIDCDNTTDTCTSFIKEINGTSEQEAKRLEGALDSSFLFSYAFFMFIR